MILSVTLSKPAKNISEILGAPYERIKIRRLPQAGCGAEYFAEFFTQKQVFHKRISSENLKKFLEIHEGTTFRSCVERTEREEIQILSNKRGKITRIVRPLGKSEPLKLKAERTKQYLIQERRPVPFLVRLGVMTAEGKVVSAKQGKFRQINRFLEILDDVLPDVQKIREKKGDSSPLRIVDFGSGKSYLTFAVQYFLEKIRKIDCEIAGLDLKKDVIDYCSSLVAELQIKNMTFSVGDIATFCAKKSPDIVITLHACDTATDYALDFALKKKVCAILSVPCCQHEVNAQLSRASVSQDSPFEPFLRFGLIKERFAALMTDAIRAELLEKAGYFVQVLEFIGEEDTPKNLMIRAVFSENKSRAEAGFPSLLKTLGVSQTLTNLLIQREINSAVNAGLFENRGDKTL